jgi:hypothetical protein
MGIDHRGSGTAWTANVVADLLTEGVGESEIEIWEGADDVIVMVCGDIKYRWTQGRQVLPEIEAIQFARAS